MARREKTFTVGHERGSGIALTLTRKGVEVDAWYDGGFGGMEGLVVTWEELLAAKSEVEKPVPRKKAQ